MVRNGHFNTLSLSQRLEAKASPKQGVPAVLAEDPTYKQGTATSDVRGKSTGADSFIVLAFQSRVSDMKGGFLSSMKTKSERIV